METAFQPYLSWYSARHLRRTGCQPAASTLKTKRLYLSSIAGSTGLVDEMLLGTSLSDREKVNTLLDTLSARLSPGALRQAFYVLKSFGEYARCKGLIQSCALLPEDLPGPGPDKPITVYSPAEMETFITAAKYHSLRWWAFLTFLGDTGRRVGEALSLEWDWFRPESTPPYFELPRSKNGDPQYLPLGTRLATEVFTPANVVKLKTEVRNGNKQWARSQELHPFPWTYATVHAMFGRFCVKHDLPNRGFHNYRHTKATDMIAKGVPIQAVASLLGHRTPAITMRRYSHANSLQYVNYLDA